MKAIVLGLVIGIVFDIIFYGAIVVSPEATETEIMGAKVLLMVLVPLLSIFATLAIARPFTRAR